MLSVTCHLTTTLCSFSRYECPMRIGEAAAGGLAKENMEKKKEEKSLINLYYLKFIFDQFKEYPP